MVTIESVEEQLKKIGFKHFGWGRTEVRELPNILIPDETIFECVNGIYEGGFALLMATNFRVLLVDKKPMNYLTVEDLRFDMINEIDYSHRLLGARISISTGSKNLKFTSYNQPRLRKLIGHVQHNMAENKKKQSEHEEDQKLHLEQINQQLQTYLLAQHQQQEKLQEQLEKNAQPSVEVNPVRPSPQLSDYLYAQGLIAQYQSQNGSLAPPPVPVPPVAQTPPISPQSGPTSQARLADLYAEGMQEVFGSRPADAAEPTVSAPPAQPVQLPATSPLQQITSTAVQHVLEINPLRIAYSKLPMAMRNKKFGRPSFHAHSHADEVEGDSLIPDSKTDIAPAQYY